MNIEQTQVTTLKITDIDKLDPVTVYLEDHGPAEGTITFTCYGQSWSAYWGGMGDQTIAEFFCSCDHHYIASKVSSLPIAVVDEAALHAFALNAVKQRLDSGEIDADEAEEIRGRIEFHGLSEVAGNEDLLCDAVGGEWWHYLPEKTNPDYEYLCRVIDTVQDAIRQTLLPAPASKAEGMTP